MLSLPVCLVLNKNDSYYIDKVMNAMLGVIPLNLTDCTFTVNLNNIIFKANIPNIP